MWGKYEEIVDDYQNATVLMARIKEIYGAHTKIPSNVLKDMLKRENWFKDEQNNILKHSELDPQQSCHQLKIARLPDRDYE